MFNLDELEAGKKEQMVALLKQSGDSDKAVAFPAQKALAAAISVPLRQGILIGDIIGNIFNKTVYDPNARIEYPIDFFRPDNAGDFRAYVLPNQGAIPSRQVEGDYITVPTYDVGAGIDFLLRYAREANWNIVSRALEVLEAGFVKKLNDDGWHTILAAAFDRNILVNDTNAVAGQFTKRLVSLAKLVMRRNGGGNSASVNRARLTHLYVSPESMEDIRNWGLDQVDDFTRREIFTSEEDGYSKIYGVNMIDLDELGEGQEYQDYYVNTTASGAANSGMAVGDLEIAIGVDAAHNDSFVQPIREELQVFEDESFHRQKRMSFYASMSTGFAVLNNSRSLLLSI